jgi:pyruvate dehydrogenase E2 component (dihydrolipoamide acetyltransferase)
MAQPIVMPELSPSMTEGKLLRWLKSEGDAVEAGEAIAEVETDKATLEVEAPASGVLGKILTPAGAEHVMVNEPIAILLVGGEGAAAVAPPAASAMAPAAAPPPLAAPRAREATAPARAGRRLFATPLARRLARGSGLDLGAIAGSGPNGRIVRGDVERARLASAPRGQATAGAVPAPMPGPAARVGPRPMPWQAATAEPNSTVRKVIARRLLEAKQTIPHYYLTADAELDALLEVRSRLNARPDAGHRLSVNDFLVKAIALALRQVPAANAMWTDEAILRFGTVDVSVAVATDSGLITPVIRDADRKSVAAISSEMADLAKRARQGKLRPEEYQGGGFTVSNLGMYGIRQFAAIINPPQSGILAVGAAEQRPVVRGGAVTIRTLMTCTLSADHRSVDGAVGARLLASFQAHLEDPTLLLA